MLKLDCERMKKDNYDLEIELKKWADWYGEEDTPGDDLHGGAAPEAVATSASAEVTPFHQVC